MAATKVVGLDIGTTAIRAVELDVDAKRGEATLLKVASKQIPIGVVRDGEVSDLQLIADTIKQMFAEAKITNKNVAIGVGNQRVVVRELEMQSLPLAQLKSSLPFSVQEFLPMSVEDALMDYYPTSEYERDGTRFVNGMFVAAQKDTVTTNVLAVESAGLKPQLVDLNGFALVRSLARGEAANQTVALIDIGARMTNVVVVSHGEPLFVRTLPSGGQNITDVVARILSIAGPEAEQLKRQIGVGVNVPHQYQSAADEILQAVQHFVESLGSTFSYYAQNHPNRQLQGILMSGGGTHLPGLGRYVASTSRLPVSLGDPFSHLRKGKGTGLEAFTGQESHFAVATGLAYGEVA